MVGSKNHCDVIGNPAEFFLAHHVTLVTRYSFLRGVGVGVGFGLTFTSTEGDSADSGFATVGCDGATDDDCVAAGFAAGGGDGVAVTAGVAECDDASAGLGVVGAAGIDPPTLTLTAMSRH